MVLGLLNTEETGSGDPERDDQGDDHDPNGRRQADIAIVDEAEEGRSGP
jgi:hypothetical protein